MINESGLPPPVKSVVVCRPPGISRSRSTPWGWKTGARALNSGGKLQWVFG